MENIKILVEKIKSKQELGKEPIFTLIDKYCKEEYTDEQILPFIEAVYHNGLCDNDLFYLTDAMKNSGDVLDLTELGAVADKHSTGGVSDTTTIVIAPICAVLGTKMLKLSGRGLGFTGGTCDKLESFTGYQTDIALDTALNLVKQNGACMITSSKNIAPADKKIYALRNRTGLVDNIQLIASSIMSKKLASGADVIVLDVKYGNGAFMPNKKQAKLLGKKMKVIGELAGKKIKIVLGKMNQPLGYNVGPMLETMEAIEILKGQKNTPLYNDSINLATLCVSLNKNICYCKAKKQVKKAITSGLALQKLKTMVSAQGGSLDLFEQKYATPTLVVKAPKSGKIVKFNTKQIGSLVGKLGTVKMNDDDQIHYEYGIRTFHKLGDKVSTNCDLIHIYTPNQEIANQLAKDLLECISIK